MIVPRHAVAWWEVAVAVELGDVSAILDRVGAIDDNVEAAIDELRGIARGLSPPLLREHGVVAALEHVARHTQVPVEISPAGVRRLSPEVESAIYYCCLEAIQNAGKHGGPGVHISVAFRERPDTLTFEIADDGPGFEANLHGGSGVIPADTHPTRKGIPPCSAPSRDQRQPSASWRDCSQGPDRRARGSTTLLRRLRPPASAT
ncbi:MAG TPA: ATP-binding protein [Solirubrobacter sp.]|nr:ATP-binding protein [Solirubrobacter sp.]